MRPSFSPSRLLVTGGAGFIGSALVRKVIREHEARVVVLDLMTYAASRASLDEVGDDPRFELVLGDIADASLVDEVFARVRPDAVVHLAAESHVDRSIDGPGAFVHTNIDGTYNLLRAAREHAARTRADDRGPFRFLHVSTDEVFGALGPHGVFSESSPYAPRSPYAASKASADHLVRAWHETYGLPTLITNCSNNYGPYQHPEKLIPTVILSALARRPIPVYGDGAQVRDWLHVEDHVDGLWRVLQRGRVGETYCLGGRAEKTNLEVVRALCRGLDDLKVDAPVFLHEDLIEFVTDRPGHDRRYAIDPTKAEQELDWRAAHSFDSGIRETLVWYLENLSWCRDRLGGLDTGDRLGLEDTTQ